MKKCIAMVSTAGVLISVSLVLSSSVRGEGAEKGIGICARGNFLNYVVVIISTRSEVP